MWLEVRGSTWSVPTNVGATACRMKRSFGWRRPNSDFAGIARALVSYAREHVTGLSAYSIDYLAPERQEPVR